MTEHKQEWRLELLFKNGERMETSFPWKADADDEPDAYYYLGYSNAKTYQKDVAWLVVGRLAYCPGDVLAAKLTRVD